MSKKLSIIVVAVLICYTAFAKKVKFAVDMTGQTINVNGVHITGDFQAAAGFAGGDWQSGTTPMTQVDSSYIYEIIVDIPAFHKYEYKFVNGIMGYEVEFVPEKSRVGYNFIDNRWLYVDSLANDTTYIGAISFGGNAPAGKKMMRFVLNMVNVWTINPTGVHVAGDFQNWNYQANYIYSFEPNLYDVIVFGDSNTTYQYKFANGNTVADTESVVGGCAINNNRLVSLFTDTIVSTVCFGACSDCLATGIVSNLNKPLFNIYPNPSDNLSYIITNENVSSVIVTNNFGEIVKKVSTGKSSQISIDRNGLTNGFYHVQLITNDGQSEKKPWVLVN